MCIKMENKLLPDVCHAQEYRLTERLSRLTEQHFLYLPTLAATINVSAEDVMGKEFLSTWNNLAVDAYLQGRTQRQRRICKFQINQQGKWHELQDCHFFQSTRVNGLLGGIERIYPRCERRFIHSDIMQKLLAHHYALLTERVGIRPWLVTCHQFRIGCNNSQSGLAAPEGRHFDGHDYVFQHFIQRQNVSGGVSEVYNAEGCCVLRHTLQHFLETLLLDDRVMQHDVTPLYLADRAQGPAFRDMLIMDFDQLGGES